MNEHNEKLAHDIGERPLCLTCGVNVRKFNYFSKKDGRPLFKKQCRVCSNSKDRDKPYYQAILRKKKNMECEKCGFKAVDRCQLDIDHIDGNHDNNDPTNHQVLCANCHRLKTKLSKDGAYTRKKTP